MEIKAPRGMQDVLPEESQTWLALEARMRELARRYGYREIRTPVVEHTEVFQRGVGAGTDIVEKEMYTFVDRGGRSLSLRAEGTAPVIRAFLNHNLGAAGLPVRVYYLCPIFRYDRPQAGRYRQHTQFGAEVIGSPAPSADAEVLSLAVRVLQHLGLEHVAVHLNSLGDAVCRPRYIEALRDYFRPHLGDLCEDCRRRFEIAPLRLLDCKQERDRRIAQGAPRMLAYLCDPCRAHFDGVQAHLSTLAIPFEIDTSIVRGLDYYTRTAWEVFSGKLGAQNAMFGGGRYDGLAEQLGGRPVPGVGFGMGLERVLLVLEQEGIRLPTMRPGPDVFVVCLGKDTKGAALLADRLRAEGLSAVTDVMARSMQAQMREANRLGASFAMFLEDGYPATRSAGMLRDMTTGTQEEILSEHALRTIAARVRAAGGRSE